MAEVLREKGKVVIVRILFASLINLADLCSDPGLAKALSNTDVKMEGLLVIGHHDSRLQIAPFAIGPKPSCSIFVAFPGTPSFLTPGYDWEWRQFPGVAAFSLEYQQRARSKLFSPARVAVSGSLVFKPNFERTSKSKANGFGYHGVYQMALLVKAVDYAK